MGRGTMNRQKIKLSQINLESSFREDQREESLELSLSSKGLRIPLVVEEVSKNKYVLVDGYRRYYALQFIGKQEAECIVEKLTSPETRLIKRLATEFHTEKRNPYQLERMINQLLAIKTLETKEIAEQCNVTVETINKYIKGKEVNPEWVKDGEKNDLGRHVLTDIHYLQNISYQTKEYIFGLYKESKITGTTVKNIDLITNAAGFKLISEEVKKECIDEVIEQGIKDKEMINEIVSKKRLQTNFSEESHNSLYNVLIKLINRIGKMLLTTHFVSRMSLNKKLVLKKRFEGLILLLNISSYKSVVEIEDSTIAKGDGSESNLEH
jgi:ParB-like chromosome segregation protein Spo0J